jgi:hypothetical protein
LPSFFFLIFFLSVNVIFSVFPLTKISRINNIQYTSLLSFFPPLPLIVLL